MQDVLQSLFLAELASPSSELWILSAWVSDIEVIDNRARAFSGIRSDWPSATIRLSSVLETLTIGGAKVKVVMRDVEHNKPFLNSLRDIQHLVPGGLGVVVATTAHDKAIVGDNFVFSGSMNLTNSGLTTNDEHMLLRVDPSAAASRRLELERQWKGELTWE